MIAVPYIKIHTNKNDFLFIPISFIKLLRDVIPKISSPHEGIGVDGIVFYERDKENFKVKYFNRDGSYSPICGNSLIAIGGLYEFLKHDREELTVQTDEGERRVKPYENGKWMALVSPLNDRIKKLQIIIEDRIYEGFYTEAPGNPHFIIEEKPEDAFFSFIAPKIAKHKEFSSGTNVEFIYIEDKKLYVRVYERGVGETQSCATGAVAIYLLYKFVKMKPLEKIYFKGGSYLFFEEDGYVGLIATPRIVSRGMILL